MTELIVFDITSVIELSVWLNSMIMIMMQLWPVKMIIIWNIAEVSYVIAEDMYVHACAYTVTKLEKTSLVFMQLAKTFRM